MSVVDPTLVDVYTALQTFIADSLGISTDLVIRGLPNRAAMPLAQPGFVVMTAVHAHRLRTNITLWDELDPSPTGLTIEQGIKLRIQFDCYGSDSGDWAAILSTLFRDQTGCDALAPDCQPLYSQDPHMAPLSDSEDQYEERWIVDAFVQWNAVVSTPMQFADTLEVDIISVDERYPAT